MLKLLKVEWLKIKNYNAFIILSSFFVVGVFAANYIVYSVNQTIVSKVRAVSMVAYSPYNFDRTWQTTSYATGWLLLLPGLLLIILITNEFTYRTNRQNIIDGWSRKQFIQVKIVMGLLTAIASTLLVIITALVFGLASGTSFSLDGVSHVAFFFLKALSYNMLAILIGVLIRRTGFAIGIFFIYMGLENFLSQLLDVWSIRLRANQDIDLGSMGDYLPMNAADGLLTFPDNPIKSLARSVMPSDYPMLVLSLAIGYLVLFIVWSTNRMLRSDL